MEGPKRANLKRKRPEAAKEHHELHEVYHACKKAKTFETQKLVKRLKQLRATGDDSSAVEDHEAQLNSIKAIDHNLLGNSAFRSKLLKDKLLRENQLVQDSLAKEIQDNILEAPAAGTPLAKIQSRLLSSKIIASQVSTSLGTLKSIIDPDSPPTKRAKSSEPSAALPKPPKTLAADQDDESSDNDSAEAQNDDDLGWESGTVDGDEDNDEDDDQEDNAEEPPEDGWESGSIHGSDGEAADHDDDDTSEEDEEGPTVKAKIKGGKAGPNPAAATLGVPSSRGKMESTFLPSLAVGFIPGSDDSDVEAEGSIAEPRKNRRGQRARRAIWEKKYGRNANHKKTETAENEKKARMEAWSRVKKSQTRPTDRGPQRKTIHREAPKAPEPSTLKKDNKDKPLHPSWEAKRKLKEKQSDAIVASQGKKIKF
ncbi:hypothetical protein EST38_g8672 [Candolleomyces aberdarensis]|uniref:Bud22 domain-containing protein n=1 Tax=Candolleomyces aberdarensis TaxID=2316362 RepID=A0A4Q2DE17_9AGAR|nr:hypothetical protein EST38_g8672 [Candolleomyces aberdarensis]